MKLNSHIFEILIQPKFLTKEDRAKAALERRKNEIDKLRATQDEDKKRNLEYMKCAKQAAGAWML